MNISVVIPCYNAADWLLKSVPKVIDALDVAKIEKAEIIIVDDGSSDNSYEVAKNIKGQYPVKVIKQKNQGRFIARKTGIDIAKYEFVLLIDTRVFIDKNALKFVRQKINGSPDKIIWNSHVNVYKTGNMIARFMDTVTNIGWRRYFSNPRDCDYGLEEFDYYPKGTTCFLVQKKLLNEVIQRFLKETTDLKNSNDDTMLIRFMAEKHRINLSPKFSCTYFARNTLKQFIPHTYHRGRVFVDGFFRKGNRFYYPLWLFLILSPIAVIVGLLAFVLFPFVVLALIALGLLVLLIFTRMMGINWSDALSFTVLAPIFTLFYGLGIWGAIIRLTKGML